MGVMRMRAICPNCGGKIHTQAKGLGHFTWMANGPLMVKTGTTCQFCGVALTGKVDMQNRAILAPTQSKPINTRVSSQPARAVIAPGAPTTLRTVDGSVIVTARDGTKTTTSAAGLVIVRAPDGTTTISRPDGSVTVRAPNGTTTSW